jgi:hypothetical protein
MTNTKEIPATIGLEDVNTEQKTEVKVGFQRQLKEKTPTARVIKRCTRSPIKNTYRHFLGY